MFKNMIKSKKYCGASRKKVFSAIGVLMSVSLACGTVGFAAEATYETEYDYYNEKVRISGSLSEDSEMVLQILKAPYTYDVLSKTSDIRDVKDMILYTKQIAAKDNMFEFTVEYKLADDFTIVLIVNQLVNTFTFSFARLHCRNSPFYISLLFPYQLQIFIM